MTRPNESHHHPLEPANSASAKPTASPMTTQMARAIARSCFGAGRPGPLFRDTGSWSGLDGRDPVPPATVCAAPSSYAERVNLPVDRPKGHEYR